MRVITDKQSAGFSLIELMVAMAIVGIISAAMFAAFQAQVQGQVSQDVSLSMTQSARAALGLMASDIRMAGCDPVGISTGGVVAGIETADSDELMMTMDIGGDPADGQPDGKIGTGETIRYAINSNGNLGRQVDNGRLQPLHPVDLECCALNFVYLDSAGNPFVPVTSNDRKKIRWIQVSVVLQSADNGSHNRGFLRAHKDTTSYKNLQSTEIYKANGDTYRRFQLNETIDCRNL